MPVEWPSSGRALSHKHVAGVCFVWLNVRNGILGPESCPGWHSRDVLSRRLSGDTIRLLSDPICDYFLFYGCSIILLHFALFLCVLFSNTSCMYRTDGKLLQYLKRTLYFFLFRILAHGTDVWTADIPVWTRVHLRVQAHKLLLAFLIKDMWHTYMHNKN